MKKIVLFSLLFSVLLTSNNFATTQVIDFNREALKRKLAQMSVKNVNKPPQIKQLKQLLRENFADIKDPQEKISVAELLKNLNELNSRKKTIDDHEKITIKETILSGITSFTSISAIKCVTLIAALYKIQGIIDSMDLNKIITDLSSTGKTISWGGGTVAIAFIVLKIISMFT